MAHLLHPLALRLLGLAALTLGLASASQAQTTVYRIAGTVGIVGSNLGTSVAHGNAFQMDLTFDASQSPWHNSGTQALYNLQSTTLTIQSSGAGALTWTRSDPAGNNINHGFSVENSTTRDALVLNGPLTGPSLNGKAVYDFQFSFIDTTKTVFTSATIPLTLTIGSFNSKLLDLRFAGFTPGQDIITFNATSLQVNPSAIPEPSTYAALAGLAAFGLVLLRRRQRAA